MNEEGFELRESKKTGDGWRTITIKGNAETDLVQMQKQIQKAGQVIEKEL